MRSCTWDGVTNSNTFSLLVIHLSPASMCWWVSGTCVVGKLLMPDSVTGLVWRVRIMGLWPNNKGFKPSPKEVCERCRRLPLFCWKCEFKHIFLFHQQINDNELKSRSLKNNHNDVDVIAIDIDKPWLNEVLIVYLSLNSFIQEKNVYFYVYKNVFLCKVTSLVPPSNNLNRCARRQQILDFFSCALTYQNYN